MEIMQKGRCTKIVETKDKYHPIETHTKQLPIGPRQWPTAVISSYNPSVFNYYKPFSNYVHSDTPIMVRDKATAAAAMRICMGNLQSGSPPPTTTTTDQQQ
jgi:hypothetical protein